MAGTVSTYQASAYPQRDRPIAGGEPDRRWAALSHRIALSGCREASSHSAKIRTEAGPSPIALDAVSDTACIVSSFHLPAGRGMQGAYANRDGTGFGKKTVEKRLPISVCRQAHTDQAGTGHPKSKGTEPDEEKPPGPVGSAVFRLRAVSTVFF